MRTFVTRPGVPDATSEIECGFSAISRMLPQRGHLGRRKSCVTGSGGLQAYWTVIVDPPRRSHTHPIYPDAAYDA